MEDVIKWVVTPRGRQKFKRANQELLDKYKESGYIIDHHDDEFFIIERAKSSRVVTCNSIETAHVIVEMAIMLENGQKPPENARKTLLEKSMMLVGRIDVMYNCRSGDKVRRRRGG